MAETPETDAEYPFDALAAALCRVGLGHSYSTKPATVGTPACPYAWQHQVYSAALRRQGVTAGHPATPPRT